MAKPKITRLSDPANPYNQKKSPTGRAQDKPKAKPATPAARKAPVPASAKPSLMQSLNDQYGGGARKRQIDAQVEAATNGKKKPKR